MRIEEMFELYERDLHFIPPNILYNSDSETATTMDGEPVDISSWVEVEVSVFEGTSMMWYYEFIKLPHFRPENLRYLEVTDFDMDIEGYALVSFTWDGDPVAGAGDDIAILYRIDESVPLIGEPYEKYRVIG